MFIDDALNKKGKEVIVDGKKTIEIVGFKKVWFVDPKDIDYHFIDKEGFKRMNMIVKEKMMNFGEDQHSRRVIACDPLACISVLQFLKRGRKLYCFAYLRSSDIKKFRDDFQFIKSQCKLVSDYFGTIDECKITVLFGSMHKYV